MFVDQVDQPFDSIESAHDFMNVLAEALLDAMKDLNRDRQLAVQDGLDRRSQAIELAQYKLKLLNCHVHKSRRILNDLRLIRRLMYDERLTPERVFATM
jgi:hypothetical protein